MLSYLELGGDQVKMRSLGWALIQSNWYFCKKGKFGSRDREDNVKTHWEKTTNRVTGASESKSRLLTNARS